MIIFFGCLVSTITKRAVVGIELEIGSIFFSTVVVKQVQTCAVAKKNICRQSRDRKHCRRCSYVRMPFGLRVLDHRFSVGLDGD